MSETNPIEAMESPAPDFDASAAARVALELYGIRGRCERLYGERDLNFSLIEQNGERHLLKIWNQTRDPRVVDFQMQALRHVERNDPGLPVPRVERDREGRTQVWTEGPGGARHIVCALSWRDGVFIREARQSLPLKTRLGESLARLDRALSSFEHPAQHRNLFWDVSRADRLRPLATDIEDPDLRSLVLRTIDQFENETRPALGGLRHQVIHQDFHLDNVLVDPDDPDRITGILDFGDALHSALVCDLAVACAYQLADGPDPLAGILPMVAGYHQVLPLRPEELRVLPGIVRARLVSSVVITSHMAVLHPVNRDYLLIDTAASADRLRRLSAEPLPAQAGRLLETCEHD